jgi:hypothetical protein
MRRTTISIIALGLAVLVPAAAAEARKPVTRVEVSAAVQRIADQAAAELEDHSATGLEALTNGAARIDRPRTSVGNYVRFGKFRMGASFALFGTNIVNGTARTLWCIGNMEVVHRATGPARVNANLTCPVS